MRLLRNLLVAALFLAWSAIAPMQAAPETVADEAPQSVAESYRLNCAPCHGATGRLDPDHPRYPHFKRPPADLTDPMFNSMEPSADWFMVVKYGGGPMGLSEQMPAYEGAFDDAQIEALVAYLKTLADTQGYPPGDLNFLRPIRTIKAFPETELLLLTDYRRYDGDEANRWKHTVYYGHRLGRRYQGEIKISRVDQGAGGHSSELELGFKWAFHHDLKRSLLLTAGIEAELPLDGGDASDVVIPYFSLAHAISDEFTLQSTLRSHLPTDDAGAGDLELSAVVHYMHSPWPRRAFPALEIKGVEPFRGRTEATLIPQVWVGLNRRGHVALGTGIELPVAGDIAYDYRLHVFLLWDIPDGPFWEGW
jgi:mono/diheme cytochrome c family protein